MVVKIELMHMQIKDMLQDYIFICVMIKVT